MKKNYEAWAIDIAEFHKLASRVEQLHFLLCFGVLAPSSHNSQPWRFKVGDNEIKVFLEPNRRLPESDENDRQSFVSLGCVIANIVTAADYYGFSYAVEYCPDRQDESLAAKIILYKNPVVNAQSPNHLIFSIIKRVTNRNQYEQKLPPDAFLAEIKKYDNSDLVTYIIKDMAVKDRLADISLAASIAAMADESFRRELSQYVKPNTTASTIGMPGFGMNIPTPISFIAPTMIRYLNMSKLSRKKDEALLKEHTPVFVVIATRFDDRTSWVKTGQVYENIALSAAGNRLSTAIWAAPIQIGEYYKDFQKILNTNFRPQAFFRIGYATKPMPHSPRLTAPEVIA